MQRRRDERSASDRELEPPPERAPRRLPAPVQSVLALQRAAGNRAVAGILARSKYTTAEVQKEIKWAMRDPGGAPATKSALLLAVYNGIRANLDPPVAVYTNVRAATTSLKQKGNIDDEDIAAFENAAELALAGEGVDRGALLAEQMRLKVKEKRPAIEAHHRNHIFAGEFNGTTPTGYHSTRGKTASTTHEAYGTAAPVANDVPGVYQRSVRSRAAPQNRKTPQSTFFPDSASEDEVLDAITSVYAFTPKPTRVTYPESLRGLQLASRGNTVYPAGGDDHLQPE
jgi:hypothetical protein